MHCQPKSFTTSSTITGILARAESTLRMEDTPRLCCMSCAITIARLNLRRRTISSGTGLSRQVASHSITLTMTDCFQAYGPRLRLQNAKQSTRPDWWQTQILPTLDNVRSGLAGMAGNMAQHPPQCLFKPREKASNPKRWPRSQNTISPLGSLVLTFPQ